MEYVKHTKNISYYIAICGYTLFIPFVIPSHVLAQIKTENHDKESPITVKVRAEMEWMQENLVLSSEQYDKVSALAYVYERKCDSLDHLHNAHIRKAEKEKCDKSKNADLKKVLSLDQYKTYLSNTGKKHTAGKSPFADAW